MENKSKDAKIGGLFFLFIGIIVMAISFSYIGSGEKGILLITGIIAGIFIAMGIAVLRYKPEVKKSGSL